MVAVVGTYHNGYVTLDKEYATKDPVRVIVTFLDDVEPTSKKRLQWSDFSFDESRKVLANVKCSLSEAVIEERRSAL